MAGAPRRGGMTGWHDDVAWRGGVTGWHDGWHGGVAAEPWSQCAVRALMTIDHPVLTCVATTSYVTRAPRRKRAKRTCIVMTPAG